MPSEEIFENMYGKFKSGDWVYFTMENDSDWGGDHYGELFYDKSKKKWVIKTSNSGIIGIGDYLEAYPNTIRKTEKESDLPQKMAKYICDKVREKNKNAEDLV